MAEPEQIIGRVPSLQPTIQRGGQRTIQVERAGENKWQRLAKDLSQINPTLRSYVQVADLEAEQFEEELAGMSLEEQQAILKKTEDELDKETRRGVMGWLTSPLNQKRKRQAIGQLASRDLVNEIEARLINPKQGDPEDLTERANLVRQEFIDNTPALQSSVFAQEGLNRASNTRIQETVANYERREEVIAKGDTAFGTTSVLYELAKDGSNLGDYTPRESESMLGAWDNLNAFSAAEQRDILGKVFENLAKNVSEEKADSLLLWASKNLNIGAAKMTELEYDGYSTMIDRTAAAAESLEEKERADLVKQKVAQFQNAHTDIEIDGQGTYNGQTYNSVDELILATKKDPAFDADQVGLAQLRRNVDDFIKTDIDPKEFRVREVLRSPFGPANAIDLGLKDLNVSYETAITSTSLADDVLMGDEELVNIQNFYMDSFQSEIEDELNSLLSSPIGSDRAEVTRQIKDFIRTRKKEVKREQENAIQQRLTFLKDKEEVKVKVSASKKATEPNTFGGLFDDAEDKELKVKQDLMVFSDVDADTKERRKAFKNLRNADAETTLRLRLIARGEIPKIKAEQPKRYYSSRSGFGGTISKEVKRVEYTLQERKEALNQLVQIEAARGKLGDALLLDQTVTKDGDRFNPKLLNSAQFPLVSKEDILELVELLDATEAERKANKVFQEAVKKANKIGEDDVLEFIRNQREIFKSGLNEID
jgi:hypothetical protein